MMTPSHYSDWRLVIHQYYIVSCYEVTFSSQILDTVQSSYDKGFSLTFSGFLNLPDCWTYFNTNIIYNIYIENITNTHHYKIIVISMDVFGKKNVVTLSPSPRIHEVL